MYLQTEPCIQSPAKLIVCKPCERVISEETDYTLINNGEILSVEVELKNVCPCSTLMVGVVIYIDGVLYAHKIKKVRTKCCTTENFCNCKCSRGCCIFPRCCKMRQDICVDGFEFLFLDSSCEDHTICIESFAHYLN